METLFHPKDGSAGSQRSPSPAPSVIDGEPGQKMGNKLVAALGVGPVCGKLS